MNLEAYQSDALLNVHFCKSINEVKSERCEPMHYLKESNYIHKFISVDNFGQWMWR